MFAKKPLALWCALTLMALRAWAVSPWLGQKHLYSVQGGRPQYFQIRMNKNHGGEVLTPLGWADFKAEFVSEQVMELDLQTDLEKTYYPIKVNPHNNDLGQFRQINRLKKIVIHGQSAQPQVEILWQECTDYGDSLNSQDMSCESNKEELPGSWTLTSQLASAQLSLGADKKVVVTLSNGMGAYIELLKKSKLKVLEDSVSHGAESFSQQEGMKFTDWQMKGSQLIFSSTVGEMVLSPIEKSQGVLRVVGVLKAKNKTLSVAGALAIDSELDWNSVSASDISGFYRAESVNSWSQPVMDGFHLSYDLVKGLSFAFVSDRGMVTSPWIWQWDQHHSEIVGQMFASSIRQGGFVISDPEELRDCIEPASFCQLQAASSYKILSQQGSRYIMLKTSDFYRVIQNESS